MRDAHQSLRATAQKLEKSFQDRVPQRLVHQTRSVTALGSSRGVSGLTREGFWSLPERSWPARCAPRSILGRLFHAPAPSPARPGAVPRAIPSVPERPRAPENEIWSIFCRFWARPGRCGRPCSASPARFSSEVVVEGGSLSESQRRAVQSNRASWHERCMAASCCVRSFRRLLVCFFRCEHTSAPSMMILRSCNTMIRLISNSAHF